VPRGVAALGYAQYLPKDQYLYTTEQLKNMICMTLGGRVAEDIVFGKISTGAQNDLERVTKMAYGMVTVYGMSSKIGNLSFYDANQEYGFTKPYSDKTAELIDIEVRNLIDECYQKTKQLLTEKRDKLEELAQLLLKKEILLQSDIEEVLGKRPFDKHEPAENENTVNESEKSPTDTSVTADTGIPETTEKLSET
jgi:cell division protease FtsH